MPRILIIRLIMHFLPAGEDKIIVSSTAQEPASAAGDNVTLASSVNNRLGLVCPLSSFAANCSSLCISYSLSFSLPLSLFLSLPLSLHLSLSLSLSLSIPLSRARSLTASHTYSLPRSFARHHAR